MGGRSSTIVTTSSLIDPHRLVVCSAFDCRKEAVQRNEYFSLASQPQSFACPTPPPLFLVISF